MARRSHGLACLWRGQTMGHRVHGTSLDGLILDARCVYWVLGFSACWCLHGGPAALKRRRGAELAGVIVCVCARDLGAEHTLPRVPDTRCCPSAWAREFAPVCGRWPSSLSLAPVCCACGDKTLRESWGACGDCGPPGAGRDGPDFGPAACPWRARCHHDSGARDSGLARRHHACPSALYA